MVTHISFYPPPPGEDGLRTRKKLKARRCAEDAALRLFAEKGYEQTTVEQIAEQAEISTTTFFRYFPTKADVVMRQQATQMPALRETILRYPAGESDLCVVRAALLSVWVPEIDPERTRHTTKAVSQSPVLRGLYADLNKTWQAGIAAALGERRGLRASDEEGQAAARIALCIFAGAIEAWTAKECEGDLDTVVQRSFDAAMRLLHDWLRFSRPQLRPGEQPT